MARFSVPPWVLRREAIRERNSEKTRASHARPGVKGRISAAVKAAFAAGKGRHRKAIAYKAGPLKERMQKMANEGLSQAEIARIVGLGKTTVGNHVVSLYRRPTHRDITPAMAMSLRARGLSYHRIGYILGCSEFTARQRCISYTGDPRDPQLRRVPMELPSKRLSAGYRWPR